MSNPMPPTLIDMATRCAETLVARAMQRLVEQAGHREIVVTVTAAPPPRQLSPAPIERKKPGPKPAKRSTKRKAIQRAEPARGRALQAPATTGRPAASSPDVASRMCRKCFKRGTAQRVAGSDRGLKCRACGFTWDMRIKREEKGGAASPVITRRIKAAREPGACRRCDHDKGAHVGDGGRCLIPRCVCGEFYQ